MSIFVSQLLAWYRPFLLVAGLLLTLLSGCGPGGGADGGGGGY